MILNRLRTSISAPAAPRWLHLSAALLLAGAVKFGLLYAGVLPFNADEAVVGLMARHILQGGRPIFFYGQAYLGSLDAWLTAGAFAVFGESVLAIRLVQTALFLAVIATTYLLGLRIYRSQWIAGAAAAFLALPPVLLTLYTTVSLGGYGEVLLLGNLLLLFVLRLAQPGREAGSAAGAAPSMPANLGGWLLFGVLAGVGFWTFPLFLVYLLPALAYAAVTVRRHSRRLALLALMIGLGFLIGAAPWFWYTAIHGLVTVREAAGAAIAGASSPNVLLAFFQHASSFLLFGPTVLWGLRPPWSARFLALPLIPFALAIHTAVVAFVIGRLRRLRDHARHGRWLLASMFCVLLLGYLFTPFGADPTGRYFLPLAVPLALFMAEMLHWLRLRRRKRSGPWRKWFAQMLALGVLLFNWWGTVQSAVDYPPGFTTQFAENAQVDQRAIGALSRFLRAQGETRGYSNYWVEYPLAFLSKEEIIFIAGLPYHVDMRYTTRDNRYAPYVDLVEASPRAAYITTLNPSLDEHLRLGLRRLDVGFQETQIGDFRVFYGLARKVTPAELGLGQECCEQPR